MKHKIRYTDEPMEAQVVHDFLPSGEEITLKEEKTRLTVTLTKKSVHFFKNLAKKQKTSYQKMIQRFLNYAAISQKI